jgi:hypothetical protein
MPLHAEVGAWTSEGGQLSQSHRLHGPAPKSNALHRVDGRMARWQLQLYDRVPVTHEALAQCSGCGGRL